MKAKSSYSMLLLVCAATYVLAACYSPSGGVSCYGSLKQQASETNAPTGYTDCQFQSWQQWYAATDMGTPYCSGSGYHYKFDNQCTPIFLCSDTNGSGNTVTVYGGAITATNNGYHQSEFTTNCGPASGCGGGG